MFAYEPPPTAIVVRHEIPTVPLPSTSTLDRKYFYWSIPTDWPVLGEAIIEVEVPRPAFFSTTGVVLPNTEDIWISVDDEVRMKILTLHEWQCSFSGQHRDGVLQAFGMVCYVKDGSPGEPQPTQYVRKWIMSRDDE